MSYEICKSIKRIPKENKLIIKIASSNVSPKTYSDYDYCKDLTLEQKDFYLFTDILSGNIHLTSSLYNYNYALLKAREYLKENNINSYDLYCKKCDYYNTKVSELVGFDITSDYYKNEDLKATYKEFRENNKDLLEELRYKSYNMVYNGVYQAFKQALEEKEDNTQYTLYNDDYKYIKLKGINGAFYYGYSSAKEKGKYKEIYVKKFMVDRENKKFEIKRVILTDKEIEKELEKENNKQLAKELIKDKEQVKKDLIAFKEDYKELDRYYFEEICKLYGVKGNLPKALISISKNSYRFNGRLTWKSRNVINTMRNNLLELI